MKLVVLVLLAVLVSCASPDRRAADAAVFDGGIALDGEVDVPRVIPPDVSQATCRYSIVVRLLPSGTGEPLFREDGFINRFGARVSSEFYTRGELTYRSTYTYQEMGTNRWSREERVDLMGDGSIDARRRLVEEFDSAERLTLFQNENFEGDFGLLHGESGDLFDTEFRYGPGGEILSARSHRNGSFEWAAEEIENWGESGGSYLVVHADDTRTRWSIQSSEPRHEVLRADFDDDGVFDAEYEHSVEPGCELRFRPTGLI